MRSETSRRWAALVLLTVAMSFAIPLAAAKIPGFGTRVQAGDPDHFPALKEPEAALCRLNAGSAPSLTDDFFYLDVGDSGAIDPGDLRLVRFRTHDAGTLVTESDEDETLQEGEECTVGAASTTLQWQDLDHNDRVDESDRFFLGHDADLGGDLSASDPEGDWWIRLQPGSNQRAGSLVRPGDAELSGGGGEAVGDGSIGGFFAYEDANASDVLDAGDHAWARPAIAGETNGTLAFRLSLDAADFGDRHAVAATNRSLTTVTTGAGSPVAACRIDFDPRDDPSGDGFYIDTDASATVSANDIRLAAHGGKGPGSLVRSTDRDEAGAGADRVSCGDLEAAWQDLDVDGAFGTEDAAFIGDDDGDREIEASARGGDWWIRLQSAGSKGPGTLLAAGDPELGNGPGQIGGLGDEVFAYVNFDAGPGFGADDEAYVIATGDWEEDAPPPLFSIRVHTPGADDVPHKKIIPGFEVVGLVVSALLVAARVRRRRA